MTVLARLLHAEILKLKRTLAVWMTLIAPYVVALLQTIVIYCRPGIVSKYPNAWMYFATTIAGLWAVMMLPLFITLETSLVSNMEHAQSHWKHLLSLPIPRWSVYISKFAIITGLVIAAEIATIIFTVIGGVLLGGLHSSVHFPFPLPVRELVVLHTKVVIGALFALTLHHWVALRWQSFTVAMGFGMMATVMSFVVINSELWGRWFPWSIPGRICVAQGSVVQMLLASTVGAIVALAAGCWDFSRQEIG